MDQSFSGGSWNMIPTMATHSNVSTPSNQDHLYLQQQQQQQHFQNPRLMQQQQQQHQQQQQQQQHQSLASHFHLLHLVENLAEVIESGNRDQQSDALINELNNHFEKCQQLLNSIAGSISSKAVTVEGQKRKLEETEQMLVKRKELIAKYKSSVEDLTNSEL